MSTIAFLCGGQGTQGPQMFDIVAGSAAAEPVFAAAAKVLGEDPRALVRRADERTLHANRTSQILCCTRSVAVWAALDVRAEDIVLAGYSVGEIAAWACAGLFTVDTLMAVVAARADAMDAATREPCGLASVRGLRRSTVEAMASDHGLHVAIVIADDAFVVGGPAEALVPFADAALRRGAQRSAPLPVHVASHTPLLAAATNAFRETLAALDLPDEVPSGLRLLSGIDGTVVYDTRDGREKLARQLSQPVEWAACLDACASLGAETVLDLGPGRPLAAMAGEAAPGARVHAVEDFKTIEGVGRWLAR